MAKRLPAHTFRFASVLAGLALASFVIYHFHIAITIWEWIGHYADPWTAAIITAAVMLGLCYLHFHVLADMIEAVAESALVRHLGANRKLYLRTTASLLLGIAIGLVLPNLKFPPRLAVASPDVTVVVDGLPDGAGHDGDEHPARAVELPNAARPLPKVAEASPRPRNDYCVNGSSFKFEACRAYIDAHPTLSRWDPNPKLNGEGGRRLSSNTAIVISEVGGLGVMDVIRLPPKRVGPPLDIQPPRTRAAK